MLSTAGTLRAYAFQRIFRGATSQRAINFGGNLHGDLSFRDSPYSVGATYFFADPLNANGENPKADPAIDNTLPGYAIRSLGELYVQFRTYRDFIVAGKFSLATPWANGADARMVPVTYQGILARRYIAPGWDAGVARIARFKSRTSSTFDANNLLTNATTPGFLSIDVTRTAGAFSGSMTQYWFYDIASLTYAQARFTLSPASSIAAQLVLENESGRAILGTIHNHTYGLQGSAKAGSLTATASYNYQPPVVYTTSNPAGIFRPVGGTVALRPLGGGMFSVAGGGIASPYTDGMTADPLFTTSLVATLVDRRSTGSAYKIGLSGTTGDGRLAGSIAHGFFDYTNPLGTSFATETEADLTYQLTMQLSLRQRWGYRASSTAPFNFLYSRTQLQYTF